MIDGVGLLKIGTNLMDVEEFYVVILDGDLHPQKFKSHSEATNFFGQAQQLIASSVYCDQLHTERC
jgi:hypothetical protein